MSQFRSGADNRVDCSTDRLRRAFAEATASAAWLRLGACRHYFCNAAVLAQGGIPSVVFGPGAIAQAPTADEWIAIAQRERAQEMVLRILKSLP